MRGLAKLIGSYRRQRAALERSTRWRAAGWLAVGAFTLVYAFGLLFPAAPLPFNEGGDCSWCIAIEEAFVRRLPFGSGLVYTYGPYGFVLAKALFPETYRVTLAAWALFTVAFWWSSFDVVRRTSRSLVVAVLLLVGVTGVVGVGLEPIYYVLVVLLVVHHYYVDDRPASPSVLLLAAALALAGLVKVSFLILAVLTIGFIAAHDAIYKRRLPWVVPAFLASLSVFWLLAGQRLPDLWPYFTQSLEVAGGYSEAMSSPGPRYEAVLFVVGAGLVLACVAAVEWHLRGRRGLLPLAGLALVLFALFKAGYVRQDVHVLIATLGLLAVALLYGPIVWTHLVGRRARAGYVAVLVVVTAVAWNSLATYANATLTDVYVGTLTTLDDGVAARVRMVLGQTDTRYVYDFYMRDIRNRNPIPPLSGPVDFYSFKQAVIIAHGVEYSPRPVFQSYAAYTPALAEANAAHLRGPGAPRYIVFNVEPIDGRFPSLDDGPSWPELLTRYNVRGAPASYLLLERAEVPREYRFEPIGEVRGRLGDPVLVPPIEGGPIWVRVDVAPTALGSVLARVYRNPMVYLTAKLASGAEHRYRLIPPMARAGFLLSPVVDSPASFGKLARPSWRDELASSAVTSFTVWVQSEREWFYRPEITVTFDRLNGAD